MTALAQLRQALARIEPELRDPLSPHLWRNNQLLHRIVLELFRLREQDQELVAYARKAQAKARQTGLMGARARWQKK